MLPHLVNTMICTSNECEAPPWILFCNTYNMLQYTPFFLAFIIHSLSPVAGVHPVCWEGGGGESESYQCDMVLYDNNRQTQ